MSRPEVKVDGDEFLVTMTVNGKQYRVRVRLDTKRACFEGYEARHAGNGRLVSSDLSYQLLVFGQQEVVAWLREKLTAKEGTVKLPFEVRVEIAFATILLRLTPEEQSQLAPFGHQDLLAMQHVAKSIRGRIVMHKRESRNLKEPMTRDYFEGIRDVELQLYLDEFPFLVRHREIYRRILGQVFTWAGGEVPKADYLKAESYLKGMRLLFILAGKASG